MPKMLVGTSGWAYSWNEGGKLDWYVANSGLGAVELNASFYRFPYRNQVLSWARKGRDLHWAVKVHRLVTHVHRFGGKAHRYWRNFRQLFGPLERRIDFYLFQLPPGLTPELAPRIARFVKKAGIGRRFALEVRNGKWFSPRWLDWARELGITWVSIDAPGLPRDIFRTADAVYLRMHGRTEWYTHRYTDVELSDIAARVRATGPRRVVVFFNNDRDMLENARRMQSILGQGA